MNNVLKLWALLTPPEKRAAVGLVLLMLVGMALEMLGVGLVVPALAVMSSDRPATPSPTLAAWLHWLGEPSRSELLMAGLVLLLMVYVLKAAFLLFTNWRQLEFGAELNNRLCRTLYTIYLCQPWTFHLQRNSAELLRSFQEVSNVSGLAVATLGALADCLVGVGILGLLLWLEPVGAIAVGSLLLTGTWVLDRVTRRRIHNWGRMLQQHSTTTFKHLGQGIHGAKDVKIFGREKYFIEQFTRARLQSVQINTKQGFVGGLPRMWYELLAVLGLCTLAAVMMWQGAETRAMIPLLGLFAASAFRLLPLVNRLSNSLQYLRFSGASIDTMSAELALGVAPLPEVSEPMAFRDSIALRNIRYRYPGAHANAVDGVSFEIPRGAAVGIIGGSGAGKSTLIDVILGLLSPTSGEVTVDGVDIATNMRGWQGQIGYVPQSIYLCDDTIRRNVAFGVPDEAIDEAAVRRAIRAAQLEGFIDELPDGLDAMVGERGVRLSGGQRQRIGIARALYHDPQVLVLDEATSALDRETERGFMQDVQALHGAKTMLIVAHRLTTVAGCDVLYRLERGRIVATGSYAELVTPSGAVADGGDASGGGDATS